MSVFAHVKHIWVSRKVLQQAKVLLYFGDHCLWSILYEKIFFLWSGLFPFDKIKDHISNFHLQQFTVILKLLNYIKLKLLSHNEWLLKTTLRVTEQSVKIVNPEVKASSSSCLPYAVFQKLVFDIPVFHPLVDPVSGELDVRRAFTKWRYALCFYTFAITFLFLTQLFIWLHFGY